MKIDKMIKQLQLYAETWPEALDDGEILQIVKWLKELKKLRKAVKNHKIVCTPILEEMAKEGIVT